MHPPEFLDAEATRNDASMWTRENKYEKECESAKVQW